MSLFSALTVSVGGLSAQSDAIGNISDNLANTETTGFKRIDTQFQTLVTQSNANRNDPGGVRARPSYQNDIQGTLVQAQSATYLAISGQGYFPVRAATTGADGLTTFSNDTVYTRRGDFALNREGFMVNGAGYYLTGYAVDSSGDVDKSRADPIQISQLLDNPVATSAATFSANLPSSAIVNYASSPSTIQVFDALGNQHDMSFTWTKTGTNAWSLNINIPQSVAPSAPATLFTDYDVDIPFVFNGTSNVGTISSITADTATPAKWTVIDNSTATENLAQISFNLAFAGAGSQSITASFGTYNQAKGTTQFADTTIAVTSFEQNGIPRGSFQDLSIDKNGFISLNYDNGRSKTVYQIPVAQFFAQNQLQRITGGAFERTIDSGVARLSAPGTVGAGTIAGNSLESSNVDIADEYTKLIKAQRVYSANARTISTADGMLQEVINIIR
jgi:flagellar hook protein FlgE